MTETAFREETTPKLRPWQAEKLNEEKRRLEETLTAPPHIANQIQDRGMLARQLRRLNTQIETQIPKPYSAGDLDLAVARERELLEEITTGMPTQAEMRRNPAGARDKHRAWEKRNKIKILEWRNIRLRRRASGASEDPDDARDICNIEIHRPVGGPGRGRAGGGRHPGAVQGDAHRPGDARRARALAGRRRAVRAGPVERRRRRAPYAGIPLTEGHRP